MSRSPVQVEQEERTMSASTTQPTTGHANQAAPFGALAILVGALALGAVGIAIGQGYNPTPASVAVTARDRGLDSPLHKGSVPQSIGVDRGLDSPLHKGSVQKWIGNDGGLLLPYGFSGPATGVQQGLGGMDVIGPNIINGRAEHNTRPPARRAGHYRD
jgi:hypothetical protein